MPTSCTARVRAGRWRGGAVLVWRGTPAGPGGAPGESRENPGVPGDPRVGDEFGAAVAARDLDGDGFDDIVIGVPGKTAERRGGGRARRPRRAGRPGARRYSQGTPGVPGSRGRRNARRRARAARRRRRRPGRPRRRGARGRGGGLHAAGRPGGFTGSGARGRSSRTPRTAPSPRSRSAPEPRTRSRGAQERPEARARAAAAARGALAHAGDVHADPQRREHPVLPQSGRSPRPANAHRACALAHGASGTPGSERV